MVSIHVDREILPFFTLLSPYGSLGARLGANKKCLLLLKMMGNLHVDIVTFNQSSVARTYTPSFFWLWLGIVVLARFLLVLYSSSLIQIILTLVTDDSPANHLCTGVI